MMQISQLCINFLCNLLERKMSFSFCGKVLLKKLRHQEGARRIQLQLIPNTYSIWAGILQEELDYLVVPAATVTGPHISSAVPSSITTASIISLPLKDQ